jgi:hypothetical protein
MLFLVRRQSSLLVFTKVFVLKEYPMPVLSTIGTVFEQGIFYTTIGMASLSVEYMPITHQLLTFAVRAQKGDRDHLHCSCSLV